MLTEFFLAWRYLFRGKTRHISFIGIISCLGIALGVGTLIIVISVMNGFDRDLMQRLMRFNYHLTVESFDQNSLKNIKDSLKAYPEVTSAAIYLQTQIFAKFDELILPLVVKGIDFSGVDGDSLKKYITSEFSEQGFFAGEGLKRRFGREKIFGYYPLKKSLQAKQGVLRGYFKVGLYDLDNNYLVTDLNQAQNLSDNYVLALGVNIRDPFMAGAVKQKIQTEFSDQPFVLTWMESNATLFSALKLEKITMFIILSLIILVATFNVFATLTVRVVEKTKDIGVLKSLGFSAVKILKVFSLQGLLLGVIGVSFGVVFGVGVCLALQKYQFVKLPQEIYALEYLPVYLNYSDISLIAVLGVFLAFLASIIPAIRAAKLEACEALRYE